MAASSEQRNETAMTKSLLRVQDFCHSRSGSEGSELTIDTGVRESVRGANRCAW